MPITTGIAVFFLIWWIVLFAVRLWGVRSFRGAILLIFDYSSYSCGP
jgi:predicted secreted protein